MITDLDGAESDDIVTIVYRLNRDYERFSANSVSRSTRARPGRTLDMIGLFQLTASSNKIFAAKRGGSSLMP